MGTWLEWTWLEWTWLERTWLERTWLGARDHGERRLRRVSPLLSVLSPESVLLLLPPPLLSGPLLWRRMVSARSARL
jgi:hypothetical protein